MPDTELKMIKTLPASQQTLIYLTGGLPMFTAAFSILNEYNMYFFLFSITIGIVSAFKSFTLFSKDHEPSKWGLSLLRMSRQLTPEAYTTVEITPSGYEFKPQIKEPVEYIVRQAVWRIAKHIQAQKTEVKIDVLEKTSLLFIQMKGPANSEFEANQLIERTNEEIEEYVRQLNGSTMYESDKSETAILIEFPNPKVD